MTEFEEAMMIRAAAQGDTRARRWLVDLYERTNGRDGLPPFTAPRLPTRPGVVLKPVEPGSQRVKGTDLLLLHRAYNVRMLAFWTVLAALWTWDLFFRSHHWWMMALPAYVLAQTFVFIVALLASLRSRTGDGWT